MAAIFSSPDNARMVTLNHLDTPEAQCQFWFECAHKRIKDGMGGLNALYEKSRGVLVGQSGLLMQPVNGEK